MIKQMRRLPNDIITYSLDEYLEKWKEISQPICNATGLKLSGFDPGFLFYDERYGSIDLPLWFVEKINKALDGGK